MGKGLLMLTDAFLYNPHCTNLLTLIFAFFMQNLGQGQFTLVTISARQRSIVVTFRRASDAEAWQCRKRLKHHGGSAT